MREKTLVLFFFFFFKVEVKRDRLIEGYSTQFNSPVWRKKSNRAEAREGAMLKVSEQAFCFVGIERKQGVSVDAPVAPA